MRIFFLFLPFLLFATPPKWYINGIKTKSYEIIGYGESTALNKAKQNAKTDIASSIKTKIEVTSSSFQSTKNYKHEFSQKSIQKSDIELSDLQVAKKEFKDGKFYVALKYINLPLAKKIKLYFKDKNLTKETNYFLKQTLFMKELKSEFGYYPKINLSDNAVIIGDKPFFIQNFEKFFAEVANKNIKLIMPKIIKNEEYYFIKIKLKKGGYLSIIQIYPNGETSLLVANKKIRSTFIYPNPKQYNGLQAYIEKGNREKDLTIALICPKKKDFSYLDTISDKKEKFGKNFGVVINNLNGCEISTKVLVIKK